VFSSLWRSPDDGIVTLFYSYYTPPAAGSELPALRLEREGN